MTYRTINTSIVERTIATNLKSPEQFPIECVDIKTGSEYRFKLVHRRVRTFNGDADKYVFQLVDSRGKVAADLGTLTVMPTLYPPQLGCDFAWTNGRFSAVDLANLASKKSFKAGKPVRAKYDKMDLYGERITYIVAGKQGEVAEEPCNGVKDGVDFGEYDLYLMSAEHSDDDDNYFY